MTTPSAVSNPANHFATLYEAARLMSSSLELDEVLQRVMDAVIAVTGAERGFVLVKDDDGAMDVKVARNLKQEEIADPRSGVSRTICNQVAANGHSVLIGDAQSHELTADAASVVALRLRSVLCVPLRVKGGCTGVVYLDHRIETGQFSDTELRLLEAVAEQASVAIENARLHDGLRRHAEEIAGLKAYQDAVLRSATAGIVGVDLKGNILSANRAAEELFGRPQDGMLGKPAEELFGAGLSSRMQRSFVAATLGRSSEGIRTKLIAADSTRHLRCSVAPLKGSDDEVTGLLLMAEDETARVVAEAAREQEQAERLRIRDLFGRFVAESVVEQLVADPSRAKLGAVQREVTVLFADIRGYTGLAERSSTEQLAITLGSYLALAAETILDHGGTLDKFMGDGVMAFFNAPLDQPDHAMAAVEAAWHMQKRAASEFGDFSFGVGVNTGVALVGNLGTDRFRNYCCVGDATNVAARLQTSAQAREVLLSRATLDQLDGHIQVAPLGALEVKGRTEPVDTYRVVGISQGAQT